MHEEFLKILRQVDMKNPKNHAAGVRAIFEVINTMDAPSLMMGFETYSYFYESILEDASEADQRSLDRMEEAIIARMLFLCSQVPSNEARQVLAYAFLNSMGDEYKNHYWRFQHAGIKLGKQ